MSIDLHTLAALISVVLYAIGFVPYIYHVFHGRVIPHPFSWSVWMLFGIINASILSAASEGWSWALWVVLFRTFALSIGVIIGWYFLRKITLTWIDYLALTLALTLTVAVHLLASSDVVSIMIVIDILIMIPTIKKIWRDPRTEDAFTWFLTSLSQGFLLASLTDITFSTAAFWIYAITMNTAVGIFIHLRYRRLYRRWYERILRFFAIPHRM